MNEQRLRQLSLKYFAGLTDTAQENELRQLLPHYSGIDRDILACAAVLGYARAAGLRRPRAEKRHPHFRAVAASITGLLALGAAILWLAKDNGNQADIDLMNSQISLLANASESVQSDISTIFTIIPDNSAI